MRYNLVCLRCGYCQPCPQGINIPEIFRAADSYANYHEEIRDSFKELYDRQEVKPEACTECRQCEERCPAGIKISERLREIGRMFAMEESR